MCDWRAFGLKRLLHRVFYSKRRYWRGAACPLPAVVAPVLMLIVAACSRDIPVPDRADSEAYPGGRGSVSYLPFASFELPAANIPHEQRPYFHAGKALANQPWIKAPSATDARDGLGPLYNARTCLGCHSNGGRGPLPGSAAEPVFSAIVRVSLPGKNDRLGVVPDASYGDQIQGQSVALTHQLRGKVAARKPADNPEAPPESRVFVDWLKRIYTYPDGESRVLRYPRIRFEELGYGPLPSNLLTSLRMAPAIHGLGLLEAIDQSVLDNLSDPQDSNGDGISGRVNRVWDFEREAPAAGRFGWKANRANLRIVSASAFQGDVGISNPIFNTQPCTGLQHKCQHAPSGNNSDGVELPEGLLALTVGFVRGIGVPLQRKLTRRALEGRALFHRTGCASCHHPGYVTASQPGESAYLGDQEIWPYTDLLLHDMGEGLDDGRPDYLASGSEWRTPPLWGVGLSKNVNGVTNLLHDGRARNIEEAILWHGGEAVRAREHFAQLIASRRDALIAFVESL